MKILVILLLLIGVSILSPVYGQEVDPNAKKMFQKPVLCSSIKTMTEILDKKGYINIIRFVTATQNQMYVYIKNPDYSVETDNRIMIIEAHPETGWGCLVDEGVGAQFNVGFWESFVGKKLGT